MRITEAAQGVQRSGFPEAYADHERRRPGARLGAHRQLPRRASAACVRRRRRRRGATGSTTTGPDPPGRRSSAATSRRRSATWRSAASRRGGVASGHMEGSAHYEGRAIDIFVRPISAENRQRGWAIAQYLVAQADRLDIQHGDLRRPDLDRRRPLGQRLARLRRPGRPRRPGGPRAPRPRPRGRLRLSRRRRPRRSRVHRRVVGTIRPGSRPRRVPGAACCAHESDARGSGRVAGWSPPARSRPGSPTPRSGRARGRRCSAPPGTTG